MYAKYVAEIYILNCNLQHTGQY